MIEVCDIACRYPGHRQPIFEDYSFSVESGEILAILGPNGSGKTTLIKSLLGLQPVSKGEIAIKGHCSYVPQATLSPFDYSVEEIVMMGASGQNGFFASPTRQDRIKTRKALEQVGMQDVSHQNFAKLSGGQKQMVLIARALVSDPDVMILDEPTSALDYHNQDKVLQTMSLVSQAGKAVIFSTHCPHQALHVSDKVLMVKKHAPGQFGTSEDILSEHHLSRLYQLPIGRHALEDGDIIVPKFSKV